MADFKERLRELIKDTNKTQKAIAEEIAKENKIELSAQTLSYYVNGREPNYDTLKIMAKYFDVSTDYLTGYSDAKKPEDEKVIEELGLTNKSIEAIKKMKELTAQIKVPGSLFPDDERTQLDLFNELISNENFLTVMAMLQIVTYPTGWSATWWEDGEPSIFPVDANEAATMGYRKVVELTLDTIIDAIKKEIADRKLPKKEIIETIKKARE